MPCVYLPGPAPAVTVANINNGPEFYIKTTQGIFLRQILSVAVTVSQFYARDTVRINILLDLLIHT